MSSEITQELSRLQHLVQRLETANDALERRICELEQQPAATEKPTTEPANEAAASRRGLVRLAGAGLAGAAAAVVARPAPAAAAQGPLVLEGFNPTTARTVVVADMRPDQEGDYVLYIYREGHDTSDVFIGGNFDGIYASTGHTGGHALHGSAYPADSIGVLGETDLGIYGVHGVRGPQGLDTPDGTAGVYGEHRNTNNIGTGVIGSHAGAGWGMWARSVSGLGIHADGGIGTGAEAITQGTRASSSGVVGRLTNPLPAPSAAAVRGTTAATNTASYGVLGTHAGTGTAVYGQCANGVGVRGFGGTGRGGVFTGAAAQLNLTPGTTATHPTAGVRGDLYVDNTGRLWFCKTGGATATWVTIA